MCLEPMSGIEHAIHALRRSFIQDRTDAILLIVAQYAFNSLCRDLALRNLKKMQLNLYNSQKLL